MKVSVNLILDKSASMNAVREETISGFNEFKNSQPSDAQFVLTMFNTTVETPERFCGRVSDVPSLGLMDYVPSGMTALYDAIGLTIERLDKELAIEQPERTVVVIQTDGQNNSSTRFSSQQIHDLIKERTEGWWQWQFVFLGADQDAYAASSVIGIGPQHTVSYSSPMTGQTLRGVGQSVAGYASGKALDLDKVKEETEAVKPS